VCFIGPDRIPFLNRGTSPEVIEVSRKASLLQPSPGTSLNDEEIAMQHKHLQFGHGFRVVLGDEHSQAAQMTLAPGATEGGSDNRHRGADQWLYVVAGTGLAIVNGQKVGLREGTLVLIQRGDRHEIRNTGDRPLQTLNVYVPPAYTDEGEELPAGKP
jgi:mannose-6-phosphate isomerase-like protein (cupin superfamily)